MKISTALKKNFKKVVYETRGIKIKNLISLMLAGGMLLTVLYSGKYIYSEYASSRAKVDLYYDEIADAQYPDKSRFTYYDFVNTDRIEAALKRVQEKGIYKNLTAQDLQDCFYIYSDLDSSVKDAVDYARSEGQNYSYVANEYSISYFQPHDYSEGMFAGLFGKDLSTEFLEALMEVNYEYFVTYCGGNGGFDELTDIGDMSIYDYDEKVAVYELRINSIIDTLNAIDRTDNDFVSVTTNKTIKDVVGEYKLLKTDLETISNFVVSSGLTGDLQVTKNKLNTNMETSTLKFMKSSDLVDINQYAQDSYDHAFTENLIVVAIDDEKGLYQARPKTAFDKVVDQKHDAMEDRAYYQSKISELTRTIEQYDTTTHSGEEYERLCEKGDELLNTFDAEYKSLCNEAREIISEYYDSSNSGFMHYRIEKRQIFDMDFFKKVFIMFVMGCIGTFIICVLFNSYQEYAKAKKKRKIAEAIRSEM